MLELIKVIYHGFKHPYYLMVPTKFSIKQLLARIFVPLFILAVVSTLVTGKHLDDIQEQVISAVDYVPVFNYQSDHYQLADGEKALYYQTQDVDLIIDYPTSSNHQGSMTAATIQDKMQQNDKVLRIILSGKQALIQIGEQVHVIDQPQLLFKNSTQFKELLTRSRDVKWYTYAVLLIMLVILNYLEIILYTILSNLMVRVLRPKVHKNFPFPQRFKILLVSLLMPFFIFKLINTFLPSGHFPLLILILIGTTTFIHIMNSKVSVNQDLSFLYENVLKNSDQYKKPITNDKELQSAMQQIKIQDIKIQGLRKQLDKEQEEDKQQDLEYEIIACQAIIFLLTKEIIAYEQKHGIKK